MTFARTRVFLGSLAVIGLSMSTAVADEWNKETIFTFNKPVEVPGKVLEPGKYVFQLLDSQTNRNIVEIFSENDKGTRRLVTIINAISDYRMETPDKTIIEFDERPGDSPEAIKRWFYPGDNYGWEFPYGKHQQSEAIAQLVAPAPEAAPAPPVMSVEAPATVEAPVEADLAIVTEEETLPVQSELETASAGVEYDQTAPEPVLPATAGQSGMLLMAGLALLATGMATLSAAARRA